MTIRAKLYAAIVLTVLGPLATTAVALNGMSQMGDRFDEVQERSQHESLARELKFQVTDMNGWQTAYGYAGGPLRARFTASANELRRQLDEAKGTLTDDHEQALLEQLQGPPTTSPATRSSRRRSPRPPSTTRATTPAGSWSPWRSAPRW